MNTNKIAIEYVLLVVGLLAGTTLCAQPKVTNVDAYPSGVSVSVTYDLSEDADISVYVSENDGKTYRKIHSDYLTGEVGHRVEAGEHRKVLWHVLDETSNEDFRGYATFKVKALPSFNPFVLATGAISGTMDWSAGLMTGMCGVAGFYVRGCTNFAQNKPWAYTCGMDGVVQSGLNPFYSGNKSVTNWMVTGGAMVRMYIPLYLYVGGGYGQRNLYWEMRDGGWVNNIAGTYRGFTGDIGLMGNIKHFAISVGVSSINFKYTEFNIGLGYML